MSYKLGQLLWALLTLIGRKSSRLSLRSGHIGGQTYTCLVTEDPDPALQTLVLLHGFTGSKDFWLPLIKQLKGRFNILAIDLPGHGDSHFDPAQDFVEQAVRVIEDVLWFHKCERIQLVGASIGALVACAYAQRNSKVSSIVLIGPAGVPVDRSSEFYAEVDEGLNPFWIHTPQAWRHLLELALKKPPATIWPLSSFLFGDYMKRQSTYRLIWDQVTDERARIRALDLTNLASLPCRKLLIWGNAERTFHADTVDVLSAHLPELRVFRDDQSGHAVHCDNPAWLAERLSTELAVNQR